MLIMMKRGPRPVATLTGVAMNKSLSAHPLAFPRARRSP